jgi:hypothetical protein
MSGVVLDVAGLPAAQDAIAITPSERFEEKP